MASAGAWRDTEASARLGDGREREREPQSMEREREREREREGPGSRLIGCPGGKGIFSKIPLVAPDSFGATRLPG